MLQCVQCLFVVCIYTNTCVFNTNAIYFPVNLLQLITLHQQIDCAGKKLAELCTVIPALK